MYAFIYFHELLLSEGGVLLFTTLYDTLFKKTEIVSRWPHFILGTST